MFANRRGLFTQLLAVFATTAVLLFLVAFFTFRVMAREKPEVIIPERLLIRISQAVAHSPDHTELQQLSTWLAPMAVFRGQQQGWWLSEGVDMAPAYQCESTDEGRFEVRDKTVFFGSPQRCFAFYDLAVPLSRQGQLLLATGIIGCLAILFVAYRVIRALFAPVQTVNDGVHRMTAGELELRLPVVRNDELGELAHSINGMAHSLQQLLNEKNDMLLAVSHEFRGPLTRARLMAEMVEQPPVRDKLVQSIQWLSKLVDALLEAEKLHMAGAGLRKTELEVRPWLQQLLADLPQQRLRIVELGEPQTLPADEARLSLALRNIVDNALQHGGDGIVRIELEYGRDHLLIVIEDEGPGMDAAQLAQLGKPFFRGDRSRSRDSGGFGLGVYLAKNIIDAHQGQLAIQSEAGLGTRVSITVPLG